MRTFKVSNGNYNYVLTRVEDRILVEFKIGNNLRNCLKTHLWYFNIKDFNELANLNKDEVVNVVERQFNEKYFQPMPYDQVQKYVKTLINNTIESINKAIDNVKNKIPDFTSDIKNVVGIISIFDGGQVKLILDEEHGKLSSYYSLISTDAGHMPVPIFLMYAGIGQRSDEEEISIVKNVLYFIKGFHERIPEERRDWESELSADDVRGAKSELFQKAVVLYNKLPKEKRYTVEEDEDEYYVEEECPVHSLPDGMGYCRVFDYEDLMSKSEDGLANEIIESLNKIRERMLVERMLR